MNHQVHCKYDHPMICFVFCSDQYLPTGARFRNHPEYRWLKGHGKVMMVEIETYIMIMKYGRYIVMIDT